MKTSKDTYIYFTVYWQISLQKDCTNYKTAKKYEYTKLIACLEFFFNELIHLLS